MGAGHFISVQFLSRQRQRAARVVAAALLALAGLCGCSSPPSMLSAAASGTAMQGKVLGGGQPVAGAAIALFAAGTAGDGAGAVSLLASPVTTDAQGGFAIAGDYACPLASSQVYIVARGGTPGTGSKSSNSALAMMTALGNCGDLSASSRIVINEVTTVAAVWALQQFMSATGSVGASPTNATGLANAFAAARNLADAASGNAPGPALPAGALTETTKLLALANALDACVYSGGGAACAPLFSAASLSVGGQTDTLVATLNIVTHPGRNVAAVFNAAPAQGPFQPSLTHVPNDWTMSITYGGCSPACGGLNLPGAVAIDSAGNVLVANYFGGVLSRFSPAGIPSAAAGIAGAGLHQSFGIAIDASDNVWVTNQQSVNAANNSHHGSVSKFSSAGSELSGAGFTGGGIYYPVAVAADAVGDVWIADYGSSSATLLAKDGSAISGAAGYASSLLPFTSAVAMDASHNAWFAAQGQVARITPAGNVSIFPCCSNPVGVAIDQLGNVWVADYNASAIVKIAPSGAVLQTTSILGGNGGPKGIAIDGAGNVWAANYFGDALVELAGPTAGAISPAQGYGLDAPLAEPYGLAIDASGNLWISNASANTLTQFVGLASPVKTPLLGPAAQP